MHVEKISDVESKSSNPAEDWHPNKRWANVPQIKKDVMTSQLQRVSEKKSPLMEKQKKKIKLQISKSCTLELNTLNYKEKVKTKTHFKLFLSPPF